MIRKLSSLRVQLTCVAVVLVLVLAGAALAPDPAEAGRYTVAQCDRSNRAHADAVFERRNGGDYAFGFRCEEDEDASSLQVHTITGTPQNHYGRVSWAAPAGAKIVGVSAEARLRSDNGHQARLSFLDAAGNEIGRLATGGIGPTGFERHERQFTDGGRERFAAVLTCVQSACQHSEIARTWVRSVKLTIEDRTPAGVGMLGTLIGGGWQRGEQSLGAFAVDYGSGVHRLDVAVNGTPVAPSQTFGCATLPGTSQASRTQPCAVTQAAATSLDTKVGPFVNGANRVVSCAYDFGEGAVPGCQALDVSVDNAVPELSFADALDPEEPELIRAAVADRHSGVASGGISYRPLDGGAWRELPTERSGGQLIARVDSVSEPPGRYLFRATASDVAGNSIGTSSRADGSDMVVTFPLRQTVQLEASIEGDDSAVVAYGGTPRLEGVLSAADGAPVAAQPVEVLEAFASGSTLEPVGRTVVTDARGRFALPLTRGPSREVTVAYAGSRRYLAAAPQALSMDVRGSSQLAVLKKRVTAGSKAVFHGSVGVYGARVEGGKLVELQVKGGGIRRYRTVRQAFRTDSRGNWRLKYKFDRFYDRPTRFSFRLKVSREGGWPYLSPSTSPARSLTVTPVRAARRGRGG